MKKLFGIFFLTLISILSFAQGVNKNGQLGVGSTTLINKNGKVNAAPYINSNGKIISPITTNGLLTYQVFSTGTTANNADDFTALTLPANQTSTGVKSGNVLLDWTNVLTLLFSGIVIPNWGDNFSMVVSGTFIPEETGNYTFTCEGDDAVDLFINNVNLVNHYGAHATYSLGFHTGVISLVAGNNYSFRARMQDSGGGEGLRVFWRKPSQASGWYINTTELSSVTQ